MLCEGEISHHVCVATSYGSGVMEKSPYAGICTGRMDAEKMRSFLSENGFKAGDIVVDATHPYAADVSENIKQAVEGTGCLLYRICRRPSGRILPAPSIRLKGMSCLRPEAGT